MVYYSGNWRIVTNYLTAVIDVNQGFPVISIIIIIIFSICRDLYYLVLVIGL